MADAAIFFLILTVGCLYKCHTLIVKIDSFYIISFADFIAEYVPPTFFMGLSVFFGAHLIHQLNLMGFFG